MNRVAKPPFSRRKSIAAPYFQTSSCAFDLGSTRCRRILLFMHLVLVVSVSKLKKSERTAGNIGVSGNNAKSFAVPTPPLQEQIQIVLYLDGEKWTQ
jgi:hypothetical protein